MINRHKPRRFLANRRQVLIGVAAFLFGSLMYLIDRPPDQIYFTANFGMDISFYNILPSEIHYLQKPFTPEVLTRKVREALGALIIDS